MATWYKDKKMTLFQTSMHANFVAAMDVFRKLPEKSIPAVEIQMNQIITLKYQMETIAGQKGYSQACKTSIPICKGECCKWHYPRRLTPMDFFIALFHMTQKQQTELSNIILRTDNNYCPILLKDGCFLSFEQRPVLCTNAYPCFNDRSYWDEKEKKLILFKTAFNSLEALLLNHHDIKNPLQQ